MLESKHTQAPSPTNKRARIIESYKDGKKKQKTKTKDNPQNLKNNHENKIEGVKILPLKIKL
jgi:hypothetical protein